MRGQDGQGWRVTGWCLWRLPPTVLIYVLVVDLIGVASSVATGLLRPISAQDAIRFAALAGCAALYIEMTRHIERKREFLRAESVAYIDTKAVWSFAATLVLPPALATAMVVFTYAVAWWRIWPRQRPVPLHRWLFSCATVLCGTQAAVAVLALGMRHYPGVPTPLAWAGVLDIGVIVVAALLRWAINAGLVMAAIALSSPPAQVRDLFENFSDQFLEAGAMALGLVAATLVVDNPAVLAAVVVAMVALHRGVLLRQYRHAARTDAKTGLATKDWWHELAVQGLARARSRAATVGVLMLDLDHFKQINDTYGHLAGDQVLHAVGKALLAETRDKDISGRWGGEEFAVLVTDVGTAENLLAVAERFRRRIHALVIDVAPHDHDDADHADDGQTALLTDLTVSIGGALYPEQAATSVDDLLLAADAALYRAKNAGRNRTCLSSGDDGAAVPEQTRPGMDTGLAS